MAASRAAVAQIAPRKKPDFTGVAGKLVDIPAGLNFSAKHRVSPYDVLLEQLAAAKGKVLEFGHPKARASVTVRAKKLGMKVLFAENITGLYVKFAGWVPDSPRWKQLVREAIVEVIATQPRNDLQVAVALRAKGIEDIDAGTVGAILKQMEQEKSVIRQRDGSWSKA